MIRLLITIALVVSTISDQDTTILLTRFELGELDLIKLDARKIETQVSDAFPDFKVTKEVGQQDGPDYIFYSVRDGNEELFIIRLDGNDSTRVDEVWMTSPRIKNQQGISIRDSFEKLKSTNENLKLYADLHYNIYASQVYNPILFRLEAGNMKMLNDSTVLSSDYSVKEWQIDNPDIEYIIWRKR